jgi:hypothetical protein
MTFGEYRDGLRLFHDFHATGDNILTLLTAIFYRPKKSFHYLKKQLATMTGTFASGIIQTRSIYDPKV